MIPPFVKVGDVWHLVINWMPEMTDRDIKLLRPLTPAEVRRVQTHLEHAAYEAWAVIVPSDEARIRARS